jgi:hypothetical protein
MRQGIVALNWLFVDEYPWQNSASETTNYLNSMDEEKNDIFMELFADRLKAECPWTNSPVGANCLK